MSNSTNNNIVLENEKKEKIANIRYYEVLFSYLKESNWNKDGSPSDEDTHYMIGKVISSDGKEVLTAAEKEDIVYFSEHCDEVKELFSTDEYAEDTLEVVQMLSQSCAGHKFEMFSVMEHKDFIKTI